MTDMKHIIQTLANYTRKSGFTVTVNSAFSTVAIEDVAGEGFFLQGEEADKYIDEAREMAAQHDMPDEDLYYSSAASYIDCLN